MQRATTVLPKANKILTALGANIKLARLRRKLSASQVAERADISRTTLYYIENGKESVSIGAYMQVLLILGLENDLSLVARDDVFGRKLQDAKLLPKERAPRRKKKQ